MKKKIFTILLLTFSILALSNVANAGVDNLSCDTSYNRVTYSYDNIYNHGWIYVNGGYKGDFKTISSGTGNYLTNLNAGDHVMILWYNVFEGYGQSHAGC